MKYRLTDHARERRKQMKVTELEIEECIEQPDTKYPCPHRRTCYQRGRLVVVLNRRHEVVTLLWHGKEGRDEA